MSFTLETWVCLDYWCWPEYADWYLQCLNWTDRLHLPPVLCELEQEFPHLISFTVLPKGFCSFPPRPLVFVPQKQTPRWIPRDLILCENVCLKVLSHHSWQATRYNTHVWQKTLAHRPFLIKCLSTDTKLNFSGIRMLQKWLILNYFLCNLQTLFLQTGRIPPVLKQQLLKYLKLKKMLDDRKQREILLFHFGE